MNQRAANPDGGGGGGGGGFVSVGWRLYRGPGSKGTIVGSPELIDEKALKEVEGTVTVCARKTRERKLQC